jgi:ubiquinone/menaquinone biosynthesis C-methylase UbiE
VRAVAQRRVEAPVLLRLGGGVDGGEALEIGPGRRGTGSRLALELFGASTVRAVELHAASARACQGALADLGDRAVVEQGDATALALPDAAVDAVFCYHLLHHAQHWRGAVAEAARVLRPGGRLYVAEMTARIVDGRPLRSVSYHPADGDRPTTASLTAACEGAGLSVVGTQERFGGCWTAVVARRP